MNVIVGVVLAAFGAVLLLNIYGVADAQAHRLDRVQDFFRTSSRPSRQESWTERRGLNPPRRFTAFVNRLWVRGLGVFFIGLGVAAVISGLR